MTIIKICGIRDIQSYLAAKDADYLGFVVGSLKSHRNISLSHFEEFLEVRNQTGSIDRIVAVTSNGDPRFLRELNSLKPDIVQLHGDARNFYHLFTVKLALSLTIEEFENGLYSELYSSLEYIVIDSIRDGYGGTGRIWKWRKIADLNTPILIAGGVNKNNFGEALDVTLASGVDISSGVEKSKKKDPLLIELTIKEVKNK